MNDSAFVTARSMQPKESTRLEDLAHDEDLFEDCVDDEMIIDYYDQNVMDETGRFALYAKK